MHTISIYVRMYVYMCTHKPRRSQVILHFIVFTYGLLNDAVSVLPRPRYMASNDWITTNAKLKIIIYGSNRPWAILRLFNGGSKENNARSQLGLPVSGLRFEPRSYRVRSRLPKHLIETFSKSTIFTSSGVHYLSVD